MAITSIDGAIAGMKPPVDFIKAATGTLVAGRPNSLFLLAGNPGAAAAPTPGIGGAALTSYAGQLPYSNPVGGGNSYLARLQGFATQAGTLMLCDRLWHNSGIDVTNIGSQAFTSSAIIPARDMNGVANGDGVAAAVEVYTATGAGVPTLTLGYNNQAGNPGVGVNQIATVASSIAGTFYPIGLAAGDTGVRQATSLTLSATWTSGTIGVVLYRVLARLELQTLTPNAVDALTSGFPRIYDNTVPFLVFVPSTTTSSVIQGHMIYTQG